MMTLGRLITRTTGGFTVATVWWGDAGLDPTPIWSDCGTTTADGC